MLFNGDALAWYLVLPAVKFLMAIGTNQKLLFSRTDNSNKITC